MVTKSFVLFTNCISRISNTQVDDADDIDVVMPIYNLIKKKNKAGKTGNNGKKNVEIMVPLIYLSNFWRTLKMP